MRSFTSLVGLSLLFLAAGCARHDGANGAVDASPAQPVTVVALATESRSALRPVAGTLRARTTAVLAAKALATVAEVRVDVGQSVQPGDLLVRLAAPEIEARVKRARAGRDQAEGDLSRERALLKDGVSTADRVRSLEEALRAAEASLTEANAFAKQLSITAPYAATVSRRLVDAGALTAPGTPVLELERNDGLRAEVHVPDSLPSPAQGASITLETPAGTVVASLAEFSNAADPVSRTRLAKLDLPETAGLRSGQFIRALWPFGTEEVLLLPANALRRFGQLESVFVVAEGRASLRLVKTAAEASGKLRLLSGVGAGEQVVLDASATLRDGALVEVRP